MGLFSSKKSSTKTTQTFYDQREVNDAGGGIIADGNVDASTTYIGSDPGAVRIGELNAALLGAVNESQTDAVKFMTQAGADVIRQAGGSATDLFELGAQNSASAWSHTLDASQSLIGRLLDSTDKTNNAAQSIAGAAIASFTPTENKQADATKYLTLAGAAVLAFVILRK